MSVIYFHLNYGTQAEEHLRVHFCTSQGHTGYIALHSPDRYVWTGELETAPSEEWLSHEYEVVRGNDVVRREDGAYRRVYIEKRSRLLLFDSWTEHGINPIFRHTAFTKCIFAVERSSLSQEKLNGQYLFLLNALPAPTGFRWGISGGSDHLGNWDPQRAVPLIRTNTYEWACRLNPKDFNGDCEYKILLLNDATPERPLWEQGENRRIPKIAADEKVYHAFVCESNPRFDLPLWHGAGVVMPVSALRSQGSQGIGDFGDLKAFVNWVADCGMHAIQILPLYDTTRNGDDGDICPYNIVSTFAMNPVYIDLREWKDLPLTQPFLEEAQALNARTRVSYSAVYLLKQRFLKALFRLQGRRILHSDAYKQFTAENRGWLDPYAQWKAARANGQVDDASDATMPKTEAEPHNLTPQDQESTGFISFQQFLLHRQLLAAHKHAMKRAVMLKCDIPMGMAHDSVALWKDPTLFHTDTQTGAPPDNFARNGQNWGFPTYNWENMEKDGCLWWRRRLMHASHYFDAYRLDHALGFFRIWEIPENQYYGTMGHFRPTHPLSGPEITQAGFRLPVWLYTRPHLSDRQYAKLAEEVGYGKLDPYFQKEGGYFTLCPEVADQRGIALHVKDPKMQKLLMDLVTDVLFLEDPDYAGCYHPRIAARNSSVYQTLPPDMQRAFDHLEHDFFYTRHDGYWNDEAKKKLKALLTYNGDSTIGAMTNTMLPCAEDLGMATSNSSNVLRELGILTLEVQTLPITDRTDEHNPQPQNEGTAFFIDPWKTGVSSNALYHSEYVPAPHRPHPYLSITTPSTHDMAPMRLCWALDKNGANACWHTTLGQTGEAPSDATPEACYEMLKQHFKSHSLWCLISWQDILSMDGRLRNPNPRAERINDPAGEDEPAEDTAPDAAPPASNWTWRMHLNIEDLYCAVDFNERLHNLLRLTGRG